MEAPVLRLRRRRRNDDGLELRRVGRRCLAPTGQGALRGARATLFAPVGQRRCCVARLVLAGSLRNAVYEAICPSGRAGRRAGRRGKNALRIRAHPSRAGRRARSMGDGVDGRFARGENCPLFPRPPRFRNHPAGRPAGSARTRPRDQSLGNPFLGKRPPKTPQAAGPCSWACRRLCPHRPTRNEKEAPMPPARGAWARRIRANGAGRRHCRPAGLLSAGAFVDAAGYALHARVFGVFRLLVRGYG